MKNLIMILIASTLLVGCVTSNDSETYRAPGVQSGKNSIAPDFIGKWTVVGYNVGVRVNWHSIDAGQGDTVRGMLRMDADGRDYPYTFASDTLTIETFYGPSAMVRGGW